MSTQGGREPFRAYRRRRNLDLNVPASEICSLVEPSVQCGTQEQADQQGQRLQLVQPSVQGGTQGQVNQEGFAVQPVLSSHQGQSLPPVTIDVEAYDDDIMESSPGAFAEAKRRNRRMDDVVILGEDERARWHAPNTRRCRCRRVPQNPVVVINLETTSDSANVVMQPPPPPREVTFTCPICMSPFEEEMSTKCGHIFCKACIKTAIATQAKCPTCRKKITVRELIRVFLPAAS